VVAELLALKEARGKAALFARFELPAESVCRDVSEERRRRDDGGIARLAGRHEARAAQCEKFRAAIETLFSFASRVAISPKAAIRLTTRTDFRQRRWRD